MPYRRRLGAIAALGIVAAALLWVAPRVSAISDDDIRAVSGVTLVNNATRKPILGLSPLTDGTVVDLTRLANANVSMQAVIAAGVRPAGVAFTMTGAGGGSYSHTETRAPYFLCGRFADCPLLTVPDTYALTIQAYTGTGSALGEPFSVRFTVCGTRAAATPLDVLFVGNSLLGTATKATGEDTPVLLRHLAFSAGRTLHLTEVIRYGSTLRRTWNDGMVATALDGTHRYDYIVLQEYSTLVATNLSAATSTLLDAYAPAFTRVLKPGGRIVLFKNWALVDPSPFRSRRAAKAAIDTNYAALSAALARPNLLAPIADEFETVIAAKGASYLIVPDGKHPNDNAIYLDAVTLYGILFHETPRYLPNLSASASDAAYLRSVAATAIGY